MIKMLYLLSVITFSLCQDIPFIESIEPAFGEFGSTIIINGSNFSPNDEDGVVNILDIIIYKNIILGN